MSKLVKVQSKTGSKTYELPSQKAEALIKGGGWEKSTGKAINSKKLEKKAEAKDKTTSKTSDKKEDKGSLMGGRVVNLKTNLINRQKLKENVNNLGIFLRKHTYNKLKQRRKKV